MLNDVEVPWDDDSRDRWIIWWYRFDPERRERRNVVVAAFDNQHEFEARWQSTSVELARRQEAGLSEPAEHLSGIVYSAGSRAAVRAARAAASERLLGKPMKARVRKRGRT